MARFTQTATKKPKGFTGVKDVKPTLTYQGGIGFSKDEKTELYSRLLTERFGNTFYESADFRQGRIAQLAMGLAKSDPVWFSNMVGWLRNDANLRSVSVMCAAVYADAMRGVSEVPEGALPVRKVTSDACSRADDPVELLAAFLHLFGRSLPQGLRNGLGDAANRLWTEYSVLKYNRSASVTMRDVLNLCHVKPDINKPYQNALFAYILDSNYGNDLNLTGLDLIGRRKALADVEPNERKRFAQENPDQIRGLTWEFLASWFEGGMDALAWETAIDQMGYMALLRNLRNFEKNGVSREKLTKVRDILADPVAVAKSRQLPYRFYTAKKFTDSDFFASALSDGFEASIKNLDPLHGRTLVMIDGSGSMMGGGYGYDSKISPNEQAGVLGAIAHSAWDCETYIYDTSVKPITFKNRHSALSNAAAISRNSHGGGTDTWGCVEKVLASKPKGHYSRVLCFTDGQERYTGNPWGGHRSRTNLDAFAGNVYVWDLAGYNTTNMDLGETGRYMFAGFDDHSFAMIQNLESANGVDWPWMS